MKPDVPHVVSVAADWLAPILLVLIVPVAITVYWVDHDTRLRSWKASVAACERGNVLRERINTKFDRYDAAFAKAAVVLENAATPVGKDLQTVLAEAAKDNGHIPLVDCQHAFGEPRWFWK